MTDDIVARLRQAYADMKTGTREDLKDAADEIVSLREQLREATRMSDHWYQQTTR